jgi:hypothetical protein
VIEFRSDDGILSLTGVGPRGKKIRSAGWRYWRSWFLIDTLELHSFKL